MRENFNRFNSDRPCRELRNEVLGALLILLVIVSGGAGYFIGSNKNATTTMTTTAIKVIPDSTLHEPCNTEVWSESYGFFGTPVLLMRPNSTAYVCVTYQTAWEGDLSRYPIPSWYVYSDNGTTDFPSFHIMSIRGGSEVVSHSFRVSASPDSVRSPGNLSYVIVVYTYTALSNSTGFYEFAAPWRSCLAMPMAVGYSASQVNASDFTPYSYPLCAVHPFEPIAEYVTGMNFTYVSFSPQ